MLVSHYNDGMQRNEYPTLEYESAFWQQGLMRVAGIDEAGRGAWAGPVTAAAVILPPDMNILAVLSEVRDSKQMTAQQRGFNEQVIKRSAAAWGVGFASCVEIDAYGILAATKIAMSRALAQLQRQAHALLIDAVSLKNHSNLPQQSIIHGDVLSLSIAAASVLAKVARDRWMTAAENRYPGYGFARHKGYGTAQHQAAIQQNGACEIHRFSFRPIAGTK